MNIVIPFISHTEKQISPEQARMIAAILGLPAELSFLSLTIDENLNMKAFARGASADMPFSNSSVPFNWMRQAPPAQQVETPIIPEDKPPVHEYFTVEDETQISTILSDES